MAKEILGSNQERKFFEYSPAEIFDACGSLVDFQVSSKTLTDIVSAVQDKKTVFFVGTHQSYLDLLIIARFLQEVNNISSEKITSIFIYSAPAVRANGVEELLKEQEKFLSQFGLIMLGIVRPEDYKSEKYKAYITPEMREETRQTLLTYKKMTATGGCIVVTPFEASLKSGKINPGTGEIYGILPDKENKLLGAINNSNAVFVTFGIDGTYKIFSPDTNKPSQVLMETLQGKSPSEKIITCKIGELFTPQLSQSSNQLEIAHQIVVSVAKLVSGPAQGAYRQECLDSLK